MAWQAPGGPHQWPAHHPRVWQQHQNKGSVFGPGHRRAFWARRALEAAVRASRQRVPRTPPSAQAGPALPQTAPWPWGAACWAVALGSCLLGRSPGCRCVSPGSEAPRDTSGALIPQLRPQLCLPSAGCGSGDVLPLLWALAASSADVTVAATGEQGLPAVSTAGRGGARPPCVDEAVSPWCVPWQDTGPHG